MAYLEQSKERWRGAERKQGEIRRVGVREGGLGCQMAPGAALSLRRLQGMDGLRGPGGNGF